jgi:hypothetical protein
LLLLWLCLEDETRLLMQFLWVMLGQMGESVGSGGCVTDRQGYGAVEDALTNVMEGCSDTSCVVIVVAVFALLVVSATATTTANTVVSFGYCH